MQAGCWLIERYFVAVKSFLVDIQSEKYVSRVARDPKEIQ
jgi:hypothetical protein